MLSVETKENTCYKTVTIKVGYVKGFIYPWQQKYKRENAFRKV